MPERFAAMFHAAYQPKIDALQEENARLDARVRELEEAQGELLETLSRSVLVSERPDYCRVCDRYFP